MTRWLIALVLVSLAAPALAEDPKQLYARGRKHFDLGEYPEAIAIWKDVYRVSKAPLVLFNIGQAYRLASDCKTALTFYDSYIRAEPNPSNLVELEQVTALCGGKVTRPDPSRPVDNPVAAALLEKPVEKPIEKPIEKPSETPIEKPPPIAPKRESPALGIAVGLVGVVLAGSAVVFALDSRKQSDKLDGFTDLWTDKETAIEKRGQRSEKLAWALGATGAVAIGVGIALIATSGGNERPHVTVAPTRGGAAVGWSTSF